MKNELLISQLLAILFIVFGSHCRGQSDTVILDKWVANEAYRAIEIENHEFWLRIRKSSNQFLIPPENLSDEDMHCLDSACFLKFSLSETYFNNQSFAIPLKKMDENRDTVLTNIFFFDKFFSVLNGVQNDTVFLDSEGIALGFNWSGHGSNTIQCFNGDGELVLSKHYLKGTRDFRRIFISPNSNYRRVRYSDDLGIIELCILVERK